MRAISIAVMLCFAVPSVAVAKPVKIEKLGKSQKAPKPIKQPKRKSRLHG